MSRPTYVYVSKAFYTLTVEEEQLLWDLQEAYLNDRLASSDKTNKILEGLSGWLQKLYGDQCIARRKLLTHLEFVSLLLSVISGNKVAVARNSIATASMKQLHFWSFKAYALAQEPAEGWEAAQEQRTSEQRRLAVVPHARLVVRGGDLAAPPQGSLGSSSGTVVGVATKADEVEVGSSGATEEEDEDEDEESQGSESSGTTVDDEVEEEKQSQVSESPPQFLILGIPGSDDDESLEPVSRDGKGKGKAPLRPRSRDEDEDLSKATEER